MLIAALSLFASALLVQFHHYKSHGYWFDKSDFDCHEIWFVGLITLGIGILIGIN